MLGATLEVCLQYFEDTARALHGFILSNDDRRRKGPSVGVALITNRQNSISILKKKSCKILCVRKRFLLFPKELNYTDPSAATVLLYSYLFFEKLWKTVSANTLRR